MMKFQRCLFPLICAAFAYFLWTHADAARGLEHILAAGQAWPLALAAIFQAAMLLNQPAFFAALYKLVGLEATFTDLAAVVWAGKFVNLVAPAGGLGETALLFEQARRRKWSLAKVSLATVLFFGFNFAVFAFMLALGLAVLAWHGDLQKFEILAAVPVFSGVFAGAGALLWVAKRPNSFLTWASKLGRRLETGPLRRFLTAGRLEHSAEELAQAVTALRDAGPLLPRATIHAVLVDGLALGVLGSCLWAFGAPLSPVILLASYAIGTLFSIVSITPQGVGIVEGSMTAALVSLGVPLEKAAAVVLAYRGFSFWLPLLCGFIAARQWSRQTTRPVPGSFPKKLPGFF